MITTCLARLPDLGTLGLSHPCLAFTDSVTSLLLDLLQSEPLALLGTCATGGTFRTRGA